MANSSSAYGALTLKWKWTPILIEQLNTIANKIWARFYYAIHLDEFKTTEESQNDKTASFLGNGRWAFSSNLEYLGEWTEYDIKDNPELCGIYNELLNGMYENDLKMEISYSDEEIGGHVLYQQTGILSSDGKTLIYKVISHKDFDYNWENYMNVIDNYSEDLYILAKNLCEQIGISDDDYELVINWASIRTYPHYTKFDILQEDTQAEFMELFRHMPDIDEIDAYLGFTKITKELTYNKPIEIPVGAKLVNFYFDTKQNPESGDYGFNEFIIKRLIDECGVKNKYNKK